MTIQHKAVDWTIEIIKTGHFDAQVTLYFVSLTEVAIETTLSACDKTKTTRNRNHIACIIAVCCACAPDKKDLLVALK